MDFLSMIELSFLSLIFFLLGHNSVVNGAGRNWNSLLKMPSEKSVETEEGNGTKWAILIAGSSGYWNYRHQADVCHAYQIIKKGGLKEENIVVFMYDDIANSEENPRPGIIINHPRGSDVYAGVPKDYTGENVTVNNLFAALLGDKSAIKGGSGKVVNSGPNDHIFIYYSDHGGSGVLGMPNQPYLYANDFVSALKKKHAEGTYKEMVIYVEACESGSIFEGLLPTNMNIYVTTAANAVEDSWGTYCPGMDPAPPPEYDTCLGDLYSVAWMEDSEKQNLKKETLAQQYHRVRERTSNHNTYNSGSHVMQYGNLTMNEEKLSLYMGSNPENSGANLIFRNIFTMFNEEDMSINQRDADLLYLWRKYLRCEGNSFEKMKAQKKMLEVMAHRMQIDRSVEFVGNLLFGSEQGPALLKAVRSPGVPLVDDWDCLKKMVQKFETHCGPLSQYGMKHMRAFANICNEGINEDTMEKASVEACSKIPAFKWSSLHKRSA
eukprot:TRINITY_DN1560_c0_g1_i1.p1 TRINITY_DN1560_c0_g1~~TRINITY_DN1560_c0_g1_i1.p1  ORF type:complete len:492 (+),score=93.14 TRINITY_DN1560_c0_g1_i1:150-1625(+)